MRNLADNEVPQTGKTSAVVVSDDTDQVPDPTWLEVVFDRISA